MAVAAAVVRAVVAAAHVRRSSDRDSHIRSRCCGIGIRSVDRGLANLVPISASFLSILDSGNTHETNVVWGKS